jgi:hypothetical protein
MSQKKYKVTLTQEEEDILHDIMNRGNTGRKNGKGHRRCFLPTKDTQTSR